MVIAYEKPFLDLDEQVDRLSERGMAFDDGAYVYQRLQAIGYYRLSGYWYPLREQPNSPDSQRPSTFVPGANFNEVLEVYHFDERLRAEVFHAVSRIEVAMRFRIGYLLGRKGPFAHTDPANLDDTWTENKTRTCTGPSCTEGCTWSSSDHEDWVRKQEHNESRSQEAFIAHFRNNYTKPLPVWTATEIMSFGDINRLFEGLTQRDRQQIAAEFDVFNNAGEGDAHVLSSWLENIRQTRNTCAHHARLWNRNQTAPVGLPEAGSELEHLRGSINPTTGTQNIARTTSRIYGTLAIIAYLLVRIDHSNTTRDNIRQLIESFAASKPKRLVSMGFPDGWSDERIWQPDYARDPKMTERSYALRDVELLYTVDAASRLIVKETDKERRSLLNYYRKNGAVLSVPGTASHRYPAFQFDETHGDLPPLVILANRRLLDGKLGSDEQRWDALRWWTTGGKGLADDLTPKRALERDQIGRDDLDRLLRPREDETA